jgi:hypothetical protein
MKPWSKHVAWCVLAVFFVVCGVSLAGCFGNSSPPGMGPDGGFDGPVFSADGPSNADGPHFPDVIEESDAGSHPEDASDGSPSTVTIGGTVTGLAGSGLLLVNEGGDPLAITADGPFTFHTHVAPGSSYAVTVSAQPVSPWQTCAVAGGTGTATGDVTTVAVTCTTSAFAIGGTVVGLANQSNAGLVLASALPGGGTDTVTVNQDGGFVFPQKLPSGAPYAVTVQTNPASPSQQCNVSGGTGTVAHAEVTSVVVNCATNSYTVGGTVTGLAGAGLVLANGTDTVSISANGTFAFPTPVPSGASYSVSVSTQPAGPTQSCTITGGAGTVGSSNVTSIAVACNTSSFSVGGTASNLLGSGLVLLDNGGDALAVTGATYAFATQVASGAPYAVTVQTQPTSPWQTCTPVATATGVVGASDVTNANVACTTNTYGVNGTVTGLTGTGLAITLNGGAPVPVTGTTFSFAGVQLASGTPYAVAVQAQPLSPSQTCTVANGTGTVGGADVTDVQITCSANSFGVGGTIVGLSGSGLVLVDNGGNATTIQPGATTFTFSTQVASGAPFDVEVQTNPTGPTQSCSPSGNKGTVGNADVTSVVVNCSTSQFTVGGTVTGLAGSGLVLANGNDTVSVSANGTFAFPTPVASGGSYAVSVKTQPSGPTQSCTISGASGSVGSSNITSVAVTCTTSTFTVGGTASNLLGSGLVLLDNGGDALAVTGSSYTFATKVASGAGYAVSVKTQPTNPWQTCTPASTASGTVGAGNVTNANVACTTNTYTVGGSVSGLTGSGLTLTLNGANPITVTSSSFTFASAPLASGTQYTVAVKAQPLSPSENCTVTSNGPGTIAGANVTNVQITCTPNPYTVGGTIKGLSGSGLVLTDNGGNATTIQAGATSFTFSTKIASGAGFDVEVQSNPSGPTQTCSASGNKGTVGNGPVTSVVINCSTNSFPVSGTVSNLLGSGLQLSDGTDTVSVTGSSFSFPPLPSGTQYNVTVAGSPTSPWQSCTVSNASGTVTTGPITNVGVSCTTNKYWISVAVNVSGGGNSVNPGMAINDGQNSLALTGPGNYLFEYLASGTSFSLSLTQPTANVTCTLSGTTSGTITDAGVGVTVTCPTVYPLYLNFSWAGSACNAPITFYDGFESIVVNTNSSAFDSPFADGRTAQQGYQVGFSSTDSFCVCNNQRGSGTIVGLSYMNPPAATVTATCGEAIQ